VLRRIALDLDEVKRREWSRSLPLGELVGDRWERARRLGFGEGSSIYDSSLVFGEVSVGAGTWVGPYTILDGSGGLKIGRHCSISAGVHIYSHETVRAANLGDPGLSTRQPVSIGDNCYIGPNAVIAMGVNIGAGSIVGACSFVNEDVPAGTKVAGVPAKPLRGSE